MKQKIKVLQITHCSHSYFLSKGDTDPDKIVKGSWGTQVGIEIKKKYPKIEVECWNPEKIEKKQKQYFHKDVFFQIQRDMQLYLILLWLNLNGHLDQYGAPSRLASYFLHLYLFLLSY